MTIRKIAQIGHPVLRQAAAPVSRDTLLSPGFQRFIDDLVETMRDARGAGLAANQIYEPVRVVAIEVDHNPRYPYKPKIPLTILVNPQIAPLAEERFDNYEGCLSVPNLRGVVQRIAKVHLTAWDRHGETIDRVYQGFTAGTVQHEVDHLDGRLFVDLVEDPRTLSTWDEYERHHKEAFMKTVSDVIARYHSSES